MTYIPPTPAATADTWGANTNQARSSSEMDKDAFMKLLVAQLKYQDPLSPADPGEFLAQTAQFTAVEKLEHIATQTSEQTWALALGTASTLIGKEISFLRMDGTTGVGVVSSATTDPDGIVLNVGDEEVPLGAITQIGSGDGSGTNSDQVETPNQEAETPTETESPVEEGEAP